VLLISEIPQIDNRNKLMPMERRELSNEDDNFPSEGEFLAIGVIAMFLYTMVMVMSVFGLYQFRGMETSVRDISFFVLMFISGASSLPWAMFYIINKDVPPFWSFVVRMVSKLTFFWAFCIVTNRWAKVLYLRQGTRVFHHYVLMGFNVILLAVAVVDVIVNSSNWEDENRHCESADFQFTILTQAVFIFAVLILWVFLGGTLLSRIESWKEVTMQRDDAVLFSKAIKNLSIIMGITGVCLAVQFIMLTLDFVDGSTHLGLSNVSYVCMMLQFIYHEHIFRNLLLINILFILQSVFTRCGVIWNSCIDFIPQVIPSMLFMMYMQRKPATKTSVLQRYDLSSIVSSDKDSAAADSLLFAPGDVCGNYSDGIDSWRS
jgi:hypothetical protein